MIYDLFYVSTKTIDVGCWNTFRSKFPSAHKIENVKTFDDIKKEAFTKMFWVVWDDIIVNDDFDFSYQVTKWDNMYVHVFKNGEYYDGICLFPKNASISNREIENRYFINKKEVDVQASIPAYIDEKEIYDIVFISYNEPNADENYKQLLSRFPNAKRVDGVKGIHQAHLKAAEISSTSMFWVVDGDAIVVDEFNFDFRVARYNKNVPHVWRSQNPINDLEYGYGGVKLFPTESTLKMDTTTVDMTTAISDRIIVVDKVSNITAFNTDPFNTWKSAFRECVKLSSKIIKGQEDEQTEERLRVWTTVGRERQFGDFAIRGALAGMEFGTNNRNNFTHLSLINDFEWLKQEFKKNDVS